MRTKSFLLLMMVLAAILSVSVGKAAAQFRALPPVGGFSGPGVYGPAGLGGGLEIPELGNGIGSSGLGSPSFNQDLIVLPDSSITVNTSGASAGGSPPPPEEPRWNAPYVAAPSADQNREDMTPSSNKVGSTSAKPAAATTNEPSGWRWKWWHGLIVLVIVGLVIGAREK